jgi:hypothetical protein
MFVVVERTLSFEQETVPHHGDFLEVLGLLVFGIESWVRRQKFEVGVDVSREVEPTASRDGE